MTQPDLEPVADALAKIAVDLPSEINLAQFSYMISALAHAYGLSGDDLRATAANAGLILAAKTGH